MPLLNTASKIYQGSSLATKVYQGSVQVWPPASPWGAPESMIGTTPNENPSGPDRSYGMRFQALAVGRITGLRFWHYATGTTTRTLYLWSDAGAVLGSVAVTTSVVNNWVVGTLTTPVNITSGTYYRVSYSVASGTLFARRSTNPVSTSARFTNLLPYYSDGLGVFPTTTVGGYNWYADVVFEPSVT